MCIFVRLQCSGLNLKHEHEGKHNIAKCRSLRCNMKCKNIASVRAVTACYRLKQRLHFPDVYSLGSSLE
jgi:hypothetical protein